MSRKPREVSVTGLYHVVFKGVDGMALFEDDDDRLRILSLIDSSFQRFGVMLLAWCLMGNHVHLVVQEIGDQGCKGLSSAMHRICGTYAQYFNKKYGRSGHLYKERFWSDTLESEGHLLAVVRYVHNNPVKAGIGGVVSYKWSSARNYYTGECGIVDQRMVLDLIGGQGNFMNFATGAMGPDPVPHAYERLSDYEACQVLELTPGVLALLENSAEDTSLAAQKDNQIAFAYDSGVTKRQIVRLARVSMLAVASAIATQRRGTV